MKRFISLLTAKDYAYIIVAVLILVAVQFRGMFVADNVGVQALTNQGYTNVRVTDNAYFAVGLRGCDNTDAARITALATNSQGKEVTMYVCAGWLFKGDTVRNP